MENTTIQDAKIAAAEAEFAKALQGAGPLFGAVARSIQALLAVAGPPGSIRHTAICVAVANQLAHTGEIT